MNATFKITDISKMACIFCKNFGPLNFNSYYCKKYHKPVDSDYVCKNFAIDKNRYLMCVRHSVLTGSNAGEINICADSEILKMVKRWLADNCYEFVSQTTADLDKIRLMYKYKITEIEEVEKMNKSYTNVDLKRYEELVERDTPFKPTPCKVTLGRCKCGVGFLDKSTKFCGNCGQRLDWGDK